MLKGKGNPEFCWALLLAGSLGAIVGVSTNFGTNLFHLGGDRLAIYGTDIQQGTPEVALYVNEPAQATEQEKLQDLANWLSRSKFCELPIEVTTVKGEVATINLQEHPWNQPLAAPPTLPGCSGRTWRYQYFQGSAGGHDTSVALARTFLQPEYSGEWIDGVQFTYEGKPIQAGQWDHLEIDGVVTRETLP